ncbi:hypothetical protein TVTCOM_31170 [Terrisporobacter vanillatitrophus]
MYKLYIIKGYKKDFDNFLSKILGESMYCRQIVTSKDQIMTLSTCSYEYDNARIAIFAVKNKYMIKRVTVFSITLLIIYYNLSSKSAILRTSSLKVSMLILSTKSPNFSPSLAVSL